MDELISVGTFSEVWRAIDQRQRRFPKVVLKIATRPAQRAALEREAELLRVGRGANLVKLIGAPVDEPGLGLVLVLADAGSAWEVAFRRQVPPVDELIRLAGQIAKALDRLHKVDILHLDVKPGNLAVHADGTACLLDLGVSARGKKAFGDNGETTIFVDQNGGLTARYAAPEHLDHHRGMGKAADQYSLAVTILEVLEGRLGSQGQLPVVEGSRLLSPGANRALLKALSMEPKARHRTCSAFVRELARG